MTEKHSPIMKHETINKSEHSEYNDSPIKIRESNDLESVQKMDLLNINCMLSK